jgi:signal transduction histidine kinase
MFFCLVMAVGALFKQRRDTSRARVALLERLHALEEEIIDISEQERRRIGRDLHDGVCQHLAAIGFTAGLLKRELASVSPAHSKLARDVADRLNETLVITRDLSRGLSPVTAEDRGLESALHDLACTSTQLTGIACQFVCPDPVLLDDTEVSVHWFRIAQEALNNATKHSSATEIIISLANTDSGLVLAVSDNGKGLPESSANDKGIGLKIMAYRARCIGSSLSIRNNIPHGTVVSCTLPHSSMPIPTPELSEYE